MPCSDKGERAKSIVWGVVIIRRYATLRTIKGIFNALQLLITPFSRMHYGPLITYFQSFQRRVKLAGMLTQIAVAGSFKIPTKTPKTGLRSHLNATDNSRELFDHCVYLFKNQIDPGK